MAEVSEMTRAATVAVPKPVDLAHPNAVVRYLCVDGKVSTELCEVVETGLRNNKVAIVPRGSGKRITLTRRRLLPPEALSAATVVEAGDRYKALCPKCGKTIAMLPGAVEAECPDDGKFPLYWLGVKPMTVEERSPGTKTAKAPGAAKTPKERKPKTGTAAVKKPGPTREPQPVDLNNIATLGELYTKPHVAFDHAHVSVQAHILLIQVGDGWRKHCFNTYNGSLGKRAKSLDLAVFQSPNHGYAVKDPGKERAQLEKQGYERTEVGRVPANRPATTPRQLREVQAAAGEPDAAQDGPAEAAGANGRTARPPAPEPHEQEQPTEVSGAEAPED